MSNANCAHCGLPFEATDDEKRPVRIIKGAPAPFSFCSVHCSNNWNGRFCTHCGATSATTLLTVKIMDRGRQQVLRNYCDVNCLLADQGDSPALKLVSGQARPT
ncbi:MAG TPA: hypothetical protein VKP88_06935 [Candidatus Paceibacterota bacterium]|nr:hypothetical protein [Candidatus Paceibacterota bacterium]